MLVGVLGPLVVRRGDAEIRVAGPMPRGVLAMLAAAAGREVTTDELSFGLWGDGPPDSARRTLHSHVSRLRAALGPGTVTSGPLGYRLDATVDAVEFEAAAATGRARLAAGDPTAVATLRAALARWRGSAYAEFDGNLRLEAERSRLEQLRLDVLQWRFTAELDEHGPPPVAELEALVCAHPTREALWALLMRALYRAGRQADALAAYQRATRMLRNELGLDPGADLRELQQLVLAQDPALRPARRTTTLTTQPEQRTISVLAVEPVTTAAADGQRAADLARLRAAVVEHAARYGGTPLAHQGARTIIAFGTPVSHEDDARRAVLAARAIARADLRAAVVTGRIVADATGQVEGPLLAAAGALVARSEPGTAVLDDQTSALVGDDRPAADPSAFVGRAADLAVLRAAFDRAIATSSVQLVAVVGEAGVGKSRLLAEFLASLGGTPAYATRCAAYGDGVALRPLADLLAQLAGAGSGADGAAALAAIGAALPAPERDDLLPWLAPLLGVDTDVVQNRFDAFSAWQRSLAALAAGPLVLAVEDVHWAHSALLDFLEQLAAGGDPVPLLVLTTSRPELFDTRPSWPAASMTVRLDPLGDAAMTELLTGVLGHEPGADLLARSAGIPLFAREFARLVAAGHDSASVPPSLHALLASRLDTVDAAHRALLAIASVAGRTFYGEQLCAAAGVPLDQVGAALETLARRQFVRRLRPPRLAGCAEYQFTHDLVVDAARDRVTAAALADHHLAFARWWQALGPGQEDIVAHHALTAYDVASELQNEDIAAVARPLAADALTVAGGRMLGIDGPAAERMLRRAVELGEPGSVEQARARAAHCTALLTVRRYDEAERAVVDALRVLEVANDEARSDAAIWYLMCCFYLGTDFAPAFSALQRAADELAPSRAQVSALAGLAVKHLLEQTASSARTAVELADRSIAIADRLGCGGEVLARLARGRARVMLGDDGGLDELQDAITAARRYEQAIWVITGQQWLAGALHHWRGPAAELAVRRDIERFAAERGLAFTISSGRSEEIRLQFELGRYRECVAMADGVAVAADDAQLRWTVVQRALALAELDELDEATVRAVESTPPVDADDLRHVLGRLIVRGRWRPADARALIDALGDLEPYTRRDGAVEQLPALRRLAVAVGAGHSVEQLTGLPDTSTPLRRAVDATLRGLAAADRAALEEALGRWEELGFVHEARAVRRDLAGA